MDSQKNNDSTSSRNGCNKIQLNTSSNDIAKQYISVVISSNGKKKTYRINDLTLTIHENSILFDNPSKSSSKHPGEPNRNIYKKLKLIFNKNNYISIKDEIAGPDKKKNLQHVFKFFYVSLRFFHILTEFEKYYFRKNRKKY